MSVLYRVIDHTQRTVGFFSTLAETETAIRKAASAGHICQMRTTEYMGTSKRDLALLLNRILREERSHSAAVGEQPRVSA